MCSKTHCLISLKCDQKVCIGMLQMVGHNGENTLFRHVIYKYVTLSFIFRFHCSGTYHFLALKSCHQNCVITSQNVTRNVFYFAAVAMTNLSSTINISNDMRLLGPG